MRNVNFFLVLFLFLFEFLISASQYFLTPSFFLKRNRNLDIYQLNFLYRQHYLMKNYEDLSIYGEMGKKFRCFGLGVGFFRTPLKKKYQLLSVFSSRVDKVTLGFKGKADFFSKREMYFSQMTISLGFLIELTKLFQIGFSISGFPLKKEQFDIGSLVFENSYNFQKDCFNFLFNVYSYLDNKIGGEISLGWEIQKVEVSFSYCFETAEVGVAVSKSFGFISLFQESQFHPELGYSSSSRVSLFRIKKKKHFEKKVIKKRFLFGISFGDFKEYLSLIGVLLDEDIEKELYLIFQRKSVFTKAIEKNKKLHSLFFLGVPMKKIEESESYSSYLKEIDPDFYFLDSPILARRRGLSDSFIREWFVLFYQIEVNGMKNLEHKKYLLAKLKNIKDNDAEILKNLLVVKY